jgi:CRP-like cAMP-binding protein
LKATTLPARLRHAFPRIEAPLLDQTSSLAPLVRRWSSYTELSDEDRNAIQRLPFAERIAPRESYLVREGEPTTSCMVLLKGFAYRQKLVTDGARQIISFHIPGEFIDLQNAILDVSDHNVQALTRTQLAVVPKPALLEIMAARPAVRRAIWLETLIDASIFREWVVNVGRRDARTRIAHLLCELVLRLRRSGEAERSVWEFPITQEQIADATGLTPVHTNRTLQSLRRDGLITLANGELSVLDWEKLAETGDFNERYLHHS